MLHSYYSWRAARFTIFEFLHIVLFVQPRVLRTCRLDWNSAIVLHVLQSKLVRFRAGATPGAQVVRI
jgi:hypothetical protein